MKLDSGFRRNDDTPAYRLDDEQASCADLIRAPLSSHTWRFPIALLSLQFY